jgi:hypothetical protein
MMAGTTPSHLGAEPLPDDILQAAQRAGLTVSWTSDTDDSSRFYCLKFSRRFGRVVFQHESFDYQTLFELAREHLKGYCEFIFVFGVRFTNDLCRVFIYMRQHMQTQRRYSFYVVLFVELGQVFWGCMFNDVRMFVGRGSCGAVSDNDRGMMAVGLLMTMLSNTSGNR